MSRHLDSVDDVKLVAGFSGRYKKLSREIGKVVIGQEKVIDELLVCLFSRGHALLIGVPGLAKTLLVRTLAGSLGWDFKRIQFTPDMMPSDITGTDILQTDPDNGIRKMQFIKGPIFANFVLADEINRAPPKTQSALLEGMQECTVTASGKMYELESPFMVAATQNPIEHEGTYPLPEAQLDRFMFNIEVGYPDREHEMNIVDQTTSKDFSKIRVVMTKEEVLVYQELIRRMPVSQHVIGYAVDIAKASRPSPSGMSYVNEYVEWGAGLRASQYMILGAKSLALFRGLPAPSCKEVRDVAMPVLRHRIIPNYKAAGKGITAKVIIQNLLKLVKQSDYTANKKVRGISLDSGLKKKPAVSKISKALKKVTQ